MIMTLAMLIAGFVIAFTKGWIMTLVVLVSLPFIGIGGALFAAAIASKDKDHEKDYA